MDVVGDMAARDRSKLRIGVERFKSSVPICIYPIRIKSGIIGHPAHSGTIRITGNNRRHMRSMPIWIATIASCAIGKIIATDRRIQKFRMTGVDTRIHHRDIDPSSVVTIIVERQYI